jgi:hypothetical protein
VAGRCKVRVYGRAVPVIASSGPIEGMDICAVCWQVERCLRRADRLSRAVVPSVVCLCVVVKPR